IPVSGAYGDGVSRGSSRIKRDSVIADVSGVDRGASGVCRRQDPGVLGLSARPSRGSAVLRYVIITPARNEEQYIGLTLESVVRQTRRPLRWVIVSDGSTDRTDDIVGEYVRAYDWITLIPLPRQRDRSFAAKVHGFNAGLESIKELAFDILGNL